MSDRQFKYYLLDANGQYIYGVQANNGNLLTTSTKRAIVDSPQGWGEQGVKYGRDEELWGVFQTITTNLKFRGDGKKILEKIFYTNDRYPFNPAPNHNAYCRLIIEKRNDTPSNTWSYETWFDGQFDFSEVKQDEDEDGNFIQILIIENSLKQVFDANKNTPYEIPITGIPEEDTILMQGVILDNEFNWVSGNLGTVAMTDTAPLGPTGYIFPMGLVQVDSTNYFRDLIFFNSQGLEVTDLSGQPLDSNSFLYTSQQFDGTITLSMEFNWLSIAGSDLSVGLIRKNMTNNVVSIVHTFYNSGPVGGTLQNASFTATHTETFLPYDYQYYIFFFPVINATYDIEVVSANMNIIFQLPLPDTDCKAITYQNYAKLLVKKAFNNQASLSSQYLAAAAGDLLYKFYGLYPDQLYITCGDALRGLANPVIKGTLSDLIEDVKVRYMCGVGMNGSSFIVETLDYFLQKANKIATVKTISRPVKTLAKDLLYNDIKVGYPEFRADDLNGRFEVNSTQDYKTNFKNITESKDLTTSYKASVYEIEFLRSEIFSSGNTKDNRNDNSIYLLYCSTTRVGGKRVLQKHSATDVVGVPSPSTHYNLELSPKRIANRHIPYIKSMYNIPDGLLDAGYTVSFIGGDRNTALETRINGAAFWTIEYSDIYPSNVPLANALPRLFQPLIIEFNAIPQANILAGLITNRYGYIEVINGNNVFGIFVLDVEVNGSDMQSYKFRGLLTPDSDVSQFIT